MTQLEPHNVNNNLRAKRRVKSTNPSQETRENKKKKERNETNDRMENDYRLWK